MSTLLLRLAGPMQSWGTQSRFTVRDTGLEPSKSGVIGLLCAALGRERTEPVDDLAALRMGVRVDREGSMRMDYQTAGGWHRRDEVGYGVPTAGGGGRRPVISPRYYLADASFLVGLEGELSLLERLQHALRAPVWQLYLGRKSYVPGVPVYLPDGLLAEVGLEQALCSYPWRWHGHAAGRPDRLRLVLETPDGSGPEVRQDQPVGAAFHTRRFALRHTRTRFVTVGTDVPIADEET